jgi:uncharacterized protein YgbK (DUF1537 family)
VASTLVPLMEGEARETMQLGVVADDVTGGADLASTLRQAGLSVIQTIGQPHGPLPAADAVVVSLKIRMVPPKEAAAEAGKAADTLRAAGAGQIYFKYCSTFDSTDRGNIGPVIDQLLEQVGGPFTVATPAYPSLGRTVYFGHLFVGDRLLSESSMRDHPLTPMTDADLVRVLGRQSANRVGLIALSTVEAGSAAVMDRCVALAADGIRVVIADAVVDRHLDTLGAAFKDLPLVTGAAGLGRSLARQIRSAHAAPVAGPGRDRSGGSAVVLSGSCSAATRAQVERAIPIMASRELNPLAIGGDTGALDGLIDWARAELARGDVMIYSTADPAAVRRVQDRLGRAEAAASVEAGFKTLARALAAAGARTFIVAGGETSGAVMDALGIRVVGFGDDIEPGVPWTSSFDPPGYHLALKSGNFGSRDFLLKALGRT